jgi:putative PIN family toxin of toxin-antitoxin system
MAIKRIVLDTNVCLDLFVFHDPRWARLLAAMEQGRLKAVTRADCRSEWLRVLDYPNLPLDKASKARAAAEFDALIECIAPEACTTRLPICRDPDDQKFMELARDANAQCLITKDKALLKLAGKTARDGLFAIKKPENCEIPA